MEKKAIFGGSFDPIHIGHLHIAYEALYYFQLDKIIFMPTGNPPHKEQSQLTEAAIRYDLVKLATEGETRFEVSDYEINKKGYSFTYETIELFAKMERNTEWYFLTGVDCLMDLHKWKKVDVILQNCKFVVFNRPGYNKEDVQKCLQTVNKQYHTEIIFLDMPLLDISSTALRTKIREGKEANYLLPYKVHKKIQKLQLYR